MLNMEGIKIEKLEGNPPSLTPTNNSSLPSVTRKELESTSTKTLVLASSLSSTYSSILSLSSSSSTLSYYSWRAQAPRPWCWPHQFSPPRPESQIWRLESSFKEILNTNFHLKALPHNNEEVDREKKSDSASKLKKKIKFAFKNKNRKMRVCV